jgi:hypothetical protein
MFPSTVWVAGPARAVREVGYGFRHFTAFDGDYAGTGNQRADGRWRVSVPMACADGDDFMSGWAADDGFGTLRVVGGLE